MSIESLNLWAVLGVGVGMVLGLLKLWFDIKSVHTLVNSRSKAQDQKIEELRAALVVEKRRGDDRP